MLQPTENIVRFFKDGKLTVIPKKESKKKEVLAFFHSLFDENIVYSEKEVNRVIQSYYDDFSIIRRYLVDYGYIQRDRYGKVYKKVCRNRIGEV